MIARPRAFVVQAEEGNHRGHVAGVVDVIADPSRLWEHVMRFDIACRDKLFPHAHGKRQVGQLAAVQMPQFAPAEPQLDAAESVRRNRHSRPRRHFTDDLLLDALGHVTPPVHSVGDELAFVEAFSPDVLKASRR